jgi:pimeloyl-ACP methyl ester carboxylesterase
MTRADIDVRTEGEFRITGLATSLDTEPGSDTPLLVCLHGGGYTARYFDVPGFSLLDTAAANGFTAISLDRPGYGGSDALPPGQRMFARNAEVLDQAITAIWERHEADHSGVVIVAHSIGAAIAVHIAARAPAWPLLGLAMHGIGTSSPEHVVGVWHGMPPGVPMRFSPAQRRQLMYGPDGTFAPDAIERAAVSTAPCLIEELLEIDEEWPCVAADLAAAVTVPVHYALAEHEALLHADRGRVEAFADLFISAPRVDAFLAAGVGHNIDHHRLGRALHLQQLAFALSCAPATPGPHRGVELHRSANNAAAQ